MGHTVALMESNLMLAHVQQRNAAQRNNSKTLHAVEHHHRIIVAEDFMALEINKLEMAWLKAETIADRTKTEAMRAAERLDDTKQKVALGGDKDFFVLLTKVETTVETLRARHAAAERQASELFDRLVEAKSQGEAHA